jgi:hypothetical protein
MPLYEVVEEVRYYHKLGLMGMSPETAPDGPNGANVTEGAFQSNARYSVNSRYERYWDANALTHFTLARLGWNPDEKLEDIVALYCRNHYGSAAAPHMAKYFLLKDEYILIALIAAAAFIVLAIIFFIADGANKKKALKRAYEEEYELDEQAVDAYYDAEEAADEAAPVAPAKTAAGCKLQDLKAKVSEKLADEKVKKVATVAAACAVTAVIVSQVGSAVKAKRRRQFYHWLG